MTENPYEPPTAPITPERRPRRSTPVGFILVLVAMFPAAGIACFTTCMTVAFNDRTPGPYGDAFGRGFIVGAIVGAIVLGLMIWWAMSLKGKGDEQTRVWTDVEGKKLEATLAWWDEKEVLLRMRDGKEVKVPIERLCDADRTSLKERE